MLVDVEEDGGDADDGGGVVWEMRNGLFIARESVVRPVPSSGKSCALRIVLVTLFDALVDEYVSAYLCPNICP